MVDYFSNWSNTGRSVLLEQPRKSGSKVISHMLSSHGGEIFLHVLNSNRSTLEDPPSISEGCGGRVTDYRITVSSTYIECLITSEHIHQIACDSNRLCFPQDFGEFMRENRLTPVSESSHDPSGKLPVERAKAQLERHTRYWPMIISQTTIFNMQAVSHIVSVDISLIPVYSCSRFLSYKRSFYHTPTYSACCCMMITSEHIWNCVVFHVDPHHHHPSLSLLSCFFLY